MGKQENPRFVTMALQTWGVVLEANASWIPKAKSHIKTCLERVKKLEVPRQDVSQEEINQLINGKLKY